MQPAQDCAAGDPKTREKGRSPSYGCGVFLSVDESYGNYLFASRETFVGCIPIRGMSRNIKGIFRMASGIKSGFPCPAIIQNTTGNLWQTEEITS